MIWFETILMSFKRYPTISHLCFDISHLILPIQTKKRKTNTKEPMHFLPPLQNLFINLSGANGWHFTSPTGSVLLCLISSAFSVFMLWYIKKVHDLLWKKLDLFHYLLCHVEKYFTTFIGAAKIIGFSQHNPNID